MRAGAVRPTYWNRTRLIRWTVYLVGAVPGVSTLWFALHDQLGADPVKVLEHTLGIWGLRFLVVGLAIRPLQVIVGVNLVAYRRAIGLLAFFYVIAHLVVYAWLDQALDVGVIVKDIVKRPYITIGMASLLILVPLAVTSNDRAIRGMGAAWHRLHRWVYAAAALGVVHYMLLTKTWRIEPFVYGAVLALLLGWRVWDARVGKARRRVARGSNRA